jgi:hypothetical protein
MGIPFCSSGEHITIAQQGFEKRMVSSFEVVEGSYDWHDLRVYLTDGSKIVYCDSPGALIFDLERQLKRALSKSNSFVNDDSFVIEGEEIGARWFKSYYVELPYGGNPYLRIWLHGEKKERRIGGSHDYIRDYYVRLLMFLHRCSKREACNLADYGCDS